MLEILSGINTSGGGSDTNLTLIRGDLQMGYYGVVPSENFITGSGLAAMVGVSQGVAINDYIGWLKFAYKGKTIYIAKSPIRHSISLDELSWRGVVNGEYVISVRGKAYRVRLMSASANADNTFIYTKPAGEYADLYWKVSRGVWESFTDEDLWKNRAPGVSNNGFAWISGIYSNKYYGLQTMSAYPSLPDALSIAITSNTATTNRHWRPVLELIE